MNTCLISALSIKFIVSIKSIVPIIIYQTYEKVSLSLITPFVVT